MRRTLFTVAFVALLSTVLSSGDSTAQSRSPQALASLLTERYTHVPGEMLVQYKRGIQESDKQRARQRVGAMFAEHVAREANRYDGGDLELVRLAPGLGVAAAMRGIEADPAVEFAEPNWVYQHMGIVDDPYYTNGSLWGMYGDQSSPANQYGSHAADAWANGNTCSSAVWVGIIDEGVMYTHPDLASNIGKNPGELAGNGNDDDANGYIDDVYGWDFDGNNNTTYDGPQDDHATHVAGTIGALDNNGKGVVGVCWSIQMINAKFLGRNGGTTANAIKAVNYMTSLKTRSTYRINLVATNNSWGGGGYSKALENAISAAGQANILFIAAAGNSGVDIDANPSYPASYKLSNVIAVAALTSTGAIASYSNYGATTVHIGAPGSGIWSTVPDRKGNASYASYSGTSMATPHVTGAAAMYASTHPLADAATIKAAILSSATPTASLTGKTTTGGRLNVSNF